MTPSTRHDKGGRRVIEYFMVSMWGGRGLAFTKFALHKEFKVAKAEYILTNPYSSYNAII